MGNFIRAANWHHWFNPVNQQKALRLAERIEKYLEVDPEAYRTEFYRFQAELEKLERMDVLEQIRSSCGCASCELHCRLKEDDYEERTK